MGNKYYLFGRGMLQGNTIFFFVKSRYDVDLLPDPNDLDLRRYSYISRSNLVKAIKRQEYACTCIFNQSNGHWGLGNEVHIYDNTGIRTNHNNTIKDNLDELITFDI